MASHNGVRVESSREKATGRESHRGFEKKSIS